MSTSASNSPYDREKSVRLTAIQAERLEHAARLSGTRPSDLIREAIARHCDAILAGAPADEWAGYIGVLHSTEGPGARASKRMFDDAVAEKHAPKNRRTRR